jgi:hypothetical protein
VARVEFHGIRLKEKFTAETQCGDAATKNRNISRKDAKAAKKIPFHPALAKGEREGDFS